MISLAKTARAMREDVFASPNPRLNLGLGGHAVSASLAKTARAMRENVFAHTSLRHRLRLVRRAGSTGLAKTALRVYRCVVAVIGLSVLVVQTGVAHNLGIRGKTWPIREPSLMQVMIARAAHVDWRAKDRQLAKQAKYDLSHLAYAPLARAQSTRVRYYLPVVTLKHNIKAPVWVHGQYVWKVVARKGTTVNPLTQGLRPPTRMLFFDPRSKAQTRFALTAQRIYPTLIQLVATGGNVRGLAKRLHWPVYYAYPFIVKGFHVQRTPTLVGVGAGPYADAVSLAQFGPGVLAHSNPGNAAAVLRAAWYGGSVSGIRKAVRVAPEEVAAHAQ